MSQLNLQEDTKQGFFFFKIYFLTTNDTKTKNAIEAVS